MSGNPVSSTSVILRLKSFFNFSDHRFEAYRQKPLWQCLIRDILAGLIVALVAIPLCVGLAIASGMTPEQGVSAGAVAGILGGVLSGSKFQISGPTAAFITIIAGIVHTFGVPFLILASLISAGIMIGISLLGWGKYFRYVPHSIIVGFTIGIAITIIVSQTPDILGGQLPNNIHHTLDKIALLPSFFQNANAHALFLALLTFYMSKKLYKISVYIPAPLIAIVLGTYIANFIWHDHLISLISTKYGHIGDNLLELSLPSLGGFALTDLILPVISITFIAALESLLSARMADKMAGNKTPYNPDKELFCQGVLNAVVPLNNGLPCTGALARTATAIRAGGVSPLTAIFHGAFIVVMMEFFASWLSFIPMACIGGLLMFVATNMVKAEEMKEIWKSGYFETFIMLFTAGLTLATDLAVAVGAATVLYYLVRLIRPSWCAPLEGAEENHASSSVQNGDKELVKSL